MKTFTLSAIVLLQAALAAALPTLLPRNTTHQCSVIVQRWDDNSFDIYDYNFAPPPSNVLNSQYITSAESIPLSNGEQLPPTTLGSQTLIIVDVANPAGPDPNMDKGKLSFAWGSEKWASTSSWCTVIPRGDQGGSYATTYNCTFPCDA